MEAITFTLEDAEIFNSLQSWGTDHLEKARRYVRRSSGQGKHQTWSNEEQEYSSDSKECHLLEKGTATDKMKIQQIMLRVERAKLPTTEAGPKVTPTKTKTKKQKQESAAMTVNASTPRDLLAVIKKTPFNDKEAQAIINVLLTKQSGRPLNTSEEWIEQGKPSESQKLKQELSEVCKALEEERNNKTDFKTQLTTMKKELNERLAGVKKAASAEHQRILADMAASHMHQMNHANKKLADMHNNEMTMRGRLEELQMEKVHTVTTYQTQVDNLSHRLQMAQNVPTPTFNNPPLLSELEQLRLTSTRYKPVR